MSFGPSVNHLIVLLMARKTISKAFLKHDIYALLESIKVRNGRSGRGVVLRVVLCEFAKIKVVAAVFNLR